MPRKYTPEERVAAFWAKVDKSGGPDACWLWTGGRDTFGYGHNGPVMGERRAPRIVLVVSGVVIPPGHYALHRCDNPPCCNPAHLFVGTQADNVADMWSKGRGTRLVGDRNGSRRKIESRPRGDAHWSRARPELLVRGERHHSFGVPIREQSGTLNARAKLTDEKVMEIRRRLAAGDRMTDIATDAGVSARNIRMIGHGVTWKHLLKDEV